ncbi:branched-chain amino acid ABC transporter permease [Thermopolyspora flexuosa]|jgi:branched-chain amino acid transport system permease protein|uniref:Amino acid/amide ABC transporter membrane protein 1 (HAAT family) n=1 Tax=Thermopolyspora flexuosa TaxID=103836 RepID=A0A543IWY1_9ACTN|nr:branched-chain amino acid ABC transporter permease [Thermopolyspora flexuosa]TQM75080.1 amino acid/amide ABC transporter membrane protein 1 (HAAT family) [Thermopolyspora flexuosa]GGM92314.1 branched-chain amino acid ABC transporter permease [Thermopolyspora flexuosa]
MTENLQILAGGISLGCVFALLALGFVIVSKATGVFNLAQGGFVVWGAYSTYFLHQQVGLPFYVAAVLSILFVALVAAVMEAVAVHKVASKNLYTPILVTFGLLMMMPPVVSAFWGTGQLTIGDPWGLKVIRIGEVAITERNVAVIVVTLIVVAVFGLFFRYTRLGLAMQATALDPEAALAQGVSDKLVHRLSWAIAGALGAFGGIMLATAGGVGLGPGLEEYALLALPVIILGGIESPLGAVVGGLIVGIIQQFAVVYAAEDFGVGFEEVVPYLLMIAVMLVRPQGLFGTRKVRRI